MDSGQATNEDLSPDNVVAEQDFSELEKSEVVSVGSVDESASSDTTSLEPPSSFVQLIEYCQSKGLHATFESTIPSLVALEFKNGREVRTVYVGFEETAEALLGQPLGEVVFLGHYAAICSYKEGWIEAAVRSHGFLPRAFVARRRIFGARALQSKDPAEIEISGGAGPTLRLTEKRGLLFLLDYGAPLYLRVESIGITEHDKAVNLLEDFSNSLFLQIDFRFDAALTLVKDRFPSIISKSSRGQLDEDSQLVYPRHSYDRSPSSLYWYARSATAMPLLQFLAFYQCIEFFFPQYSRREVIDKVRNILKDPSFDCNKDSYVNTILNATSDRRASLLEERKQLAATLQFCIDAVALRDFLHETESRKKYFSTEYKKISDKKISLSAEGAIVEQTADRIYDIRCKIVHTKNAEGLDTETMILPFSRESDLLSDDVELIKFLTRKVLIASGAPLNV